MTDSYIEPQWGYFEDFYAQVNFFKNRTY